MTVIEKRKDALLLYLAKQRQFTTAEELAKVLNISIKTVYRLVKSINDDANQTDIIFAQKGLGYKLSYESYDIYRKTSVDTIENSNLSPIERRNKIMEELLLRAPKPVYVNDLFYKYYISDTVIANDEKRMMETLSSYHLTYERKNKQVRILGNEEDIRKAMNMIVNINVIDIEELKRNTNQSLNTYDVSFILQQLRLIEVELGTEIPHPYNINIFSHLYILMSRIHSSGSVLMNRDDFPTEKEKQLISLNQPIYDVARKVLENIERHIYKTVSEAEVYHVFQYLLSSRIKENTNLIFHMEPLVKEITDVYMNSLGSRLGVVKDESNFYRELSQHIRPMINRLQNAISIKNTLLESIKLEYHCLFDDVQNVSNRVSEMFNLPTISDDENGFITLYFARMLEEHPKMIKTLIMCTTGVGTSELLKVKVKKKFPELEIVSMISSRDVSTILQQYPDIELILTTVQLSFDLHITTILVSAMFTIVDQERVQNKIEGLRNEK